MTTIQLPPTITNFVRANQTNILMSAGIAGATATAVLSFRSGMRTARLLDSNPKAQTRRERFGLVWKELLLPAGSAVLTAASIVGLDKAHSKKIASVAAAYALSERALSELKKETVQSLGEKKAEEIADKVAQNTVDAKPPSVKDEFVTVNEKQTLACELWTQRYFWTNIDMIKRAELRVNQLLSTGENHITMAEFYDDLEIPHPSFAHDFGWYAGKPLVIKYSSVLTPSGTPVIAFDYNYVDNLADERRRR